MSYSYPQVSGWSVVPMPQFPGPKQITFRQNESVGMTQSPFTMQSQFQAWPGADWWEADVSLPPMSQTRARMWIAFLAALRGKLNVFPLGDPSWRVPQGSGLGSPTLSGAHLATATQLYTTGWTPPRTPNIQVDSDAVSPSSWSPNPTSGPNAFMNLTGAAAVYGNGWGLYGNGATTPAAQYVQSPNSTVGSGTWTASVYIDARGVAPGGQLSFQIWANGTLVGSGNQVAGQTGRVVSAPFYLASSCTTYFRFLTGSVCTIAPNTPGVWSNPQINAGSTAAAYASPAALFPGDYLQIGYRMHMVSGPLAVYPDASGNAQIEIWPSLRENQSSGFSLGVYNPTGLFRLADNKREWSVDEARHAGISFKAVEAR